MTTLSKVSFRIAQRYCKAGAFPVTSLAWDYNNIVDQFTTMRRICVYYL